MKKFHQSVLLLLLSITLGLVLCELAVRVLVPQQAQLYTYDPATIWSYRPNTHSFAIYAEENVTKKIRVDINSHGFRDIEQTIDQERPLILAVGDSMIAGTSLSVNETVIGVMREQLAIARPEYQIINTGVSGWSTEQEILFLESRGLSYRPDHVVLFFYIGNDVTNNYDRNHLTIKNNTLKKNTRQWKDTALLRAPYYFLNSGSQLFLFANTMYHTIWYANPAASDAIIHSPWCESLGLEPTEPLMERLFMKEDAPGYEHMWKKNSQLLLYLKQRLDKERISLTVVILPSIVQTDASVRADVLHCLNASEKDIDIQKPNIELREILDGNGIAYIDLTDTLAANDDIYIPKDIHYTGRGARVVGTVVARELAR